jgi:foldase protein PrsA
MNVKVTDAEVQKQIDDIKKQQVTQKGSYEKFLQTAGLTNEDVLFQQRVRELQDKITAKITKGKDKVTDAQIAAYYNSHKSQFATQERRNVRIVLTKTKAKADAAKAALAGGQSWSQVAKRYSIDQQSKNSGGKLPGVSQGSQEKAFDTAIFKAKKGQTVGPVKTQFGYYVFEVTKITPASQQTLAQASETIKNLLKSQAQQKALSDFVKNFQDTYRGKTKCAKGFVTSMCSNGPKPSTGAGGVQPGQPQGAPPTSGGSSGAPQGAPAPSAPSAPQGAPQQGAPPSQPGAPPGG